MKVFALVGPSGTGKSYKAIIVAKELGIEYIIDDGLLIKGNKVIAGKSAKREGSAISAVKRALFIDTEHRHEVIKAIDYSQPESLLILGTSDKMVEKIARILNIPDISERIYINDISTPNEIRNARKQRRKEGKHVIPVPTFEIKKDFSGYFVDTLKIFRRKNKEEQVFEKTVVRPTFSYLGKYTIADSVIKDLTRHAAMKIYGISKVLSIYVENMEFGVNINVDVEVIYGEEIILIIRRMQEEIIKEVEYMTSLNILAVNVNVKKMTKM